jgi:putative ABC transport system permease protein
MNDFTLSLRSWRRRPAAAATIVATLAIGVGATAALAALIYSVLLAPLPFADQGELMTIWLRDTARDHPFVEVSYPDYLDWVAGETGFESLAAMPATDFGLALTGYGEPQQVHARAVSASFFDLLGTAPELGRTFRAEDDEPGAEPVAIISHGLWAELFARDPSAVVKPIVLEGTPYTVVGVMPESFDYPAGTELWLPIEAIAPQSALENRGIGWLVVVGRLADGISRSQATAALDTVATSLDREHWSRDDRRSVVTPLYDQIVGEVRPPLLALGAGVLLVVLIGCANVAGLLLARAADRDREVAVRVALGAAPGRLVRAAMIEMLPLGIAGGVLGGLLATWILGLAKAVPGLPMARIFGLGSGIPLAVAALLLALAAASLCALAPALAARRSARRSPADRLRGHGGSASPGRRGARDFLVAAEMALAVVVVAGALLLGRSMAALYAADLGFESRGLLTLDVPIQSKYQSLEEWRVFFERVVERVETIPGVESAAGVYLRPLWGPVGFDGAYVAEGQTDEEARRNPHVNLEGITTGYFDTMGIRLLAGRDVSDADDLDSPGVIVVSESMARRAWPGVVTAQEAIGKRLRMSLGQGARFHREWLTVVGVVADARYREIEAARLDVYQPSRQFESGPLRHLAVRASGTGAESAAALAPAVRAVIRELDAAQPIDDVRTMEAIVADAVATRRLAWRLFLALAALALGLAAIGVHGLMAQRVTTLRREIGVRMALGARRADVVRDVLTRALFLAGVGGAIGLAAALVLARTVESMLYEVPTTDPLSFTGAAAALVALALAGAYLPARRAGRVDPSVVLREE